MANPDIYRKRLIPNECILLKDDTVLEANDEIIVTKWKTLKPRRDFHHGYSCYFLKAGYKVSKFYRENGSLLYWYCDIVDYSFDEKENALIVTDLLADVVIYPDGYIKVLDIGELAIALQKNLCEPKLVASALIRLDRLLTIIYEDKFDTLSSHVERWIERA
ncbi:MAG: DUF402 domain-containing protein [Lachnospiraceae bacterium]|nr:DUF402 domain-containing protein [Lachnospiraceae bacterium]